MLYEILQNTKGNPTDKENLDARIMGKLDDNYYVNNYEVVADIEAEDLDEVFEIGNVGGESKITRYAKMHSISVGDVIRDKQYSYVVSGIGFKMLSLSTRYLRMHKEIDDDTWTTSRNKWK